MGLSTIECLFRRVYFLLFVIDVAVQRTFFYILLNWQNSAWGLVAIKKKAAWLENINRFNQFKREFYNKLCTYDAFPQMKIWGHILDLMGQQDNLI